MVQSAYWEANSYSASQENSRILCNSKVHHRVHKRPPLLPILKQTNSVHALEFCFINICFNIILHLRFGLSGWLSLTSLQQNSICISHPHTCHMVRPSHYPWFDRSGSNWWGPQTMQLLVVPFSPISCPFLLLTPTRRPVERPQLWSSEWIRRKLTEFA